MRNLVFAAIAALAIALPAQAQYVVSGSLTSTTCTGTGGGAQAQETGCLVMNLSRDVASVNVQITSNADTLQFEVTNDSSNWVSANAFPQPTGTAVTSTTSTGIFMVDTAGASRLRVRASAGSAATFTMVQTTAPPVRTDGIGFNNTPLAPRYCDKSIAFTTQSTTSIVKQISEVANQHIYVCGWILHASTATTGTSLTWYSGSGASCGSGSNAAVGGPIIGTTPTAAPATPNSVYGPSNPAMRLTLAAGDALCTKQASTTNATTLSGTIFYTVN